MKSPLIIDRPDLQVWQQKAMFGALTALFWVLWIFLWMPLITLVAWLFFGQRFQLYMFELDGYKTFMGLLAVYCLVIGIMGGALLLWAVYNHLRFRGIDRRREMDAPSATAMGDLINHPSTAIDSWRNYAIVTVHHDAQGGIQEVVPTLLPAASPLTPPAGSKLTTQSLA
jgi:biofilm PGA synthesis protein PgaD